MKTEYSYPKEKVRILLTEKVHPVATEHFAAQGYLPETHDAALSPDALPEALTSLHVIGIRSKTCISASALGNARQLLAIGCYCVGTDQVDLDAAAACGVPVFNAPFANTRSVAELTMANIVALSRKSFQRSMELHGGVWRKSASGCYEVRGKVLGVVGYGHIGQQIGLLAEAFGMEVKYYDIVPKLPLSMAYPVESLQVLLQSADYVTMHVPDTPQTRGMINRETIRWMKSGAYLLNLSRGTVVDPDALREAILDGHIAGAAVDVYPKEPSSNDEPFESVLRNLDNVILTPHIGGSTLEAQRNIGLEVTGALLRFIETGSTMGAVNFPQLDMPQVHESHRVLNIHRNEPGALRKINSVVADMGVNIDAQRLETKGHVGYLIMDVDCSMSREVKQQLDRLETNIRTRLLF